MGKSQ